MTLEITNQVRIQNYKDHWYTVEDTYLDVGGEGFTISYWWEGVEGKEIRMKHICLSKEEGLAVADAIQKLFKN